MDPWIAKAEAALRTGQPKLAELYMRRGLSESPGGRFWLQAHDLGVALGAFGRALSRRANDQSAYALAGPSKGGASWW